MDKKGEIFTGQKFNGHDFSGQKLQFANFSRCTLLECNFTNTDLGYSNFTGANCYGSNFTGASLYRANMMDASLQRTIFKPRDAFGLTITIKCDTFRDMEVDQDWLEVWSFIPSLMNLPEPRKGMDKWLDRIIRLVTPERYVKLKAVFDRRII